MLKIAVCDDETVFQKKIKKFVIEYLNNRKIECEIDCFASGEELLKRTKHNLDYEIIFLDVNMQEIDGIETAKRIRILSEHVYIVFVTAFISYALTGYQVNAIRFLLKSDKDMEKSMKECLDTLIKKMNYKERWQEFEFKSGKQNMALDRILYIESRLHKVIFYILEDGIKEYYMYDKLDHIQNILTGKGFCRTHQSFVVNMKYAANVERYKVVLTEGTEINISKKYYKEVEKEFLKLKGDI